MSNDTLDQQLKQNGSIETKSNAIKFGLIGGLGGIIISLILFFANLQYESWSKWLQSLVMIAAIVIGVKTIAAANKHKVVSFGALFGAGMLITTIIAIISIVYFFLYSNFILVMSSICIPGNLPGPPGPCPGGGKSRAETFADKTKSAVKDTTNLTMITP